LDPSKISSGLARSLGTFGVVLLAVSLVSPAGSLLVVGADIVHQVGGAALPAFLIATPVVLASAILSAELFSAFPQAGGLYVIVARIWGAPLGIVVLALLMSGTPAFVAMFTNGIVPYLQADFPALPALPTTMALLAAATFIALLNIRANAVITAIFLAIEVLTIALITGLGTAHPARGAIAAIALPPPGLMHSASLVALGVAAVSANWAISGASQAVYFSEEMHQPRHLGRVIVIAALAVVALEVAPLFGLLLGAPASQDGGVLGAPSPFVAFIAASMPPAVTRVYSLGIAAALFNAVIAMIVAYARMWFASGRDRIWPLLISHSLDRIHPRTKTPVLATLGVGCVSALFCLLPFHMIVVYSAALGLLCDTLVPFTVLKGRHTGVLANAPYKAPAAMVLVVLTLLGEAAAILATLDDPDAGRPGMLVAASVVVVALVYYNVSLRRRVGGWALAGAAD
jgi:amino acid transporter